MPHSLQLLPDSTGTAAENMAIDFLLLNNYSTPDALRFRHYEWARPAYTFGLSQAYSYALSEIPDKKADICRRPTGGGVVSHLEDWTYSLVIPFEHGLARAEPAETYRAVHQQIVDALAAQGANAVLNTDAPDISAPSVCFEKSEVHDVVLRNLPSKVAGAAQKRTKAGYLLQGSIWKPILPDLDWTRFYNDFTHAIAQLADVPIEFVPRPEWPENDLEQLVSQFESDEWNQRR